MNIKNIQNEIILLKIIIIILILNVIFMIFNNQHIYRFPNNDDSNNSNLNYKILTFVILRRTKNSFSGLFSFYILYLGCINKYINLGFIPIIDVMSYPNSFNGFNKSNNNNWEMFFNQPFGYTLKNVKKRAKHIKYIECTGYENRPDPKNIYYNQVLIHFWHDFAKKYMPINNEILFQSETIMKHLFKRSTNILGVKLRGTDYISKKPKGHPIPPSIELVISDIKKLNIKFKYDWIFITSEDEIIKAKFINPKKRINYNYKLRGNIVLNKDIIGNLDYTKNYLINIIILSKCIDLISSRGSGAAGIFIL